VDPRLIAAAAGADPEPEPHAQWGASSKALYTVAAAKEDLGLYDDDTFDAQLARLVAAAQEWAAAVCGEPLAATPVTDHYAGLWSWMPLSRPPAAKSPVRLAWRTRSGDVDFASLATPAGDSDDIEVDWTDWPAALALTAAGEARARALLAAEPLSDRARRPVSASYTAGISTRPRASSAPASALKDLVLSSFNSGSDFELARAAKARALETLRPYAAAEL